MKTKMVELKSFIKYGDLTKLAHLAKISPTTLSNIIDGKVSMESYPELPKILGEYVVQRTKELQGQVDLAEQTREAAKKLNLLLPTEDDMYKKKLTFFRIKHMSPAKLLEVNEKLYLRVKTQHSEDWSRGDWEDFAFAIIDKLGLKERRRR